MFKYYQHVPTNTYRNSHHDLCEVLLISYQEQDSIINNLIVVSFIKGGIPAKGIWKQDPEANIWAQEEWEWGVEKAPQWGTS